MRTSWNVLLPTNVPATTNESATEDVDIVESAVACKCARDFKGVCYGQIAVWPWRSQFASWRRFLNIGAGDNAEIVIGSGRIEGERLKGVTFEDDCPLTRFKSP